MMTGEVQARHCGQCRDAYGRGAGGPPTPPAQDSGPGGDLGKRPDGAGFIGRGESAQQLFVDHWEVLSFRPWVASSPPSRVRALFRVAATVPEEMPIASATSTSERSAMYRRA